MEIFFLFFSNIVWVLNIKLDWVFLELHTYDLVQSILIERNIESSRIGFHVFHAIKFQ